MLDDVVASSQLLHFIIVDQRWILEVHFNSLDVDLTSLGILTAIVDVVFTLFLFRQIHLLIFFLRVTRGLSESSIGLRISLIVVFVNIGAVSFDSVFPPKHGLSPSHPSSYVLGGLDILRARKRYFSILQLLSDGPSIGDSLLKIGIVLLGPPVELADVLNVVVVVQPEEYYGSKEEHKAETTEGSPE